MHRFTYHRDSKVVKAIHTQGYLYMTLKLKILRRSCTVFVVLHSSESMCSALYSVCPFVPAVERILVKVRLQLPRF